MNYCEVEKTFTQRGDNLREGGMSIHEIEMIGEYEKVAKETILLSTSPISFMMHQIYWIFASNLIKLTDFVLPHSSPRRCLHTESLSRVFRNTISNSN